MTWDARGASTRDALGGTQCWLHLKVQTRLALTCQRCLGRLMWPVDVERAFRFVADEATAEEQDETSEEDVLVLTADLDLQSLIEDEVLNTFAVQGEPKAVGTEIVRRFDHLVDRFTLYTPYPLDDSARAEVVEGIRAATAAPQPC